jgi:putative Mg2+ transporter-C (MgtC) family protein
VPFFGGTRWSGRVTTAATIWLVTVIGLCFGGGPIWLGLAGTAIALITLWLMRLVEDTVLIGWRGIIAVTMQAGGPDERELLRVMKQRGLAVRSRHVAYDNGGSNVSECSGWYRGGYLVV